MPHYTSFDDFPLWTGWVSAEVLGEEGGSIDHLQRSCGDLYV